MKALIITKLVDLLTYFFTHPPSELLQPGPTTSSLNAHSCAGRGAGNQTGPGSSIRPESVPCRLHVLQLPGRMGTMRISARCCRATDRLEVALGMCIFFTRLLGS